MTWVRVKCWRFKVFQSTHLHEVWLWIMMNIMMTIMVSIHTPTWGVTIWTTDSDISYLGFNPHTYMRCDTLKSRHVQSLSVSIHTPTWGVTPLCILLLCLIFVSIHTPTWGVTHHAILLVTKSWFQSTHLHEVWLVLLHFDWLPLGFNPHTYMRCDKASFSYT